MLCIKIYELVKINIGDIMDYLTISLKTIFFYFFVVFLYRLMGKREVGQLGVIDLIVSILIAELVAISIDKVNDSIFIAVIPIVLLTIFQIVMAYLSLKNNKIRNFFDGKPSVIINKGKINFKEMVKQKYNLDDLLTQLRDKDYRSIDEVEYAVLENNGKLSVFEKEKDKKGDFPLPLILDGVINSDTLKFIKKDEEWLLKNINTELYNIFYAFYQNNKIYIIKQNELE